MKRITTYQYGKQQMQLIWTTTTLQLSYHTEKTREHDFDDLDCDRSKILQNDFSRSFSTNGTSLCTICNISSRTIYAICAQWHSRDQLRSLDITGACNDTTTASILISETLSLDVF